MNKKVLVLLLVDALFLASGIMLILISCIQFNNWWPILTVFVDIVAIIFTAFCDNCNMDSEEEFWFENSVQTAQTSVAWLLRGFLVVTSYAIPVELYRVKVLSETGLYLTLGGSTTILVAALIFVRVIYFTKDKGSAYLV